MIAMKKSLSVLALSVLLCACATSPASSTLYEQLGGEAGVTQIVDNFIVEISFDSTIVKHFENTDQNRFRTKLIEQICELSDGPCRYTGDSMAQSHDKMNISESEFNKTVDLLIAAMNKAGTPLAAQNRLLARLKTLREEIIYR